MNDPTIIGLVITAIIAPIVTFFLGKKKSNAEIKKLEADTTTTVVGHYELIIKQLNGRIEELNASYKQTSKKLNLALEKIQSLENSMEWTANTIPLIENLNIKIPYPVAVKDTRGKMIFVNTAYEKIFGKIQSEYFSKTDVELHGRDTGKEYWDRDKWVIENKKTFDQICPVEINGGVYNFRINKSPQYVGSVLVCVLSIIIPPIDFEIPLT